METQTDTDSETLPPHRTVSPGYNSQGEAEEAILHEVALIASDKMTGDGGDNSGNHSSEEELEEINTNKKTYVEPERDCKRKWTDLSQSDTSCESDTEFEEPELRLEVRQQHLSFIYRYFHLLFISSVEVIIQRVTTREAPVPQPEVAPVGRPPVTRIPTTTIKLPGLARNRFSSLLLLLWMFTNPGVLCHLLQNCLGSIILHRTWMAPPVSLARPPPPALQPQVHLAQIQNWEILAAHWETCQE